METAEVSRMNSTTSSYGSRNTTHNKNQKTTLAAATVAIIEANTRRFATASATAVAIGFTVDVISGSTTANASACGSTIIANETAYTLVPFLEPSFYDNQGNSQRFSVSWPESSSSNEEARTYTQSSFPLWVVAWRGSITPVATGQLQKSETLPSSIIIVPRYFAVICWCCCWWRAEYIEMMPLMIELQIHIHRPYGQSKKSSQ